MIPYHHEASMALAQCSLVQSYRWKVYIYSERKIHAIGRLCHAMNEGCKGS